MRREGRLRKLEEERKAEAPTRVQVLAPGAEPGTWRDGAGRIWREEELVDEAGLTRIRIVYVDWSTMKPLTETGAPLALE